MVFVRPAPLIDWSFEVEIKEMARNILRAALARVEELEADLRHAITLRQDTARADKAEARVARLEKDVERLEGEVKSLTEAIEPGSWR